MAALTTETEEALAGSLVFMSTMVMFDEEKRPAMESLLTKHGMDLNASDMPGGPDENGSTENLAELIDDNTAFIVDMLNWIDDAGEQGGAFQIPLHGKLSHVNIREDTASSTLESESGDEGTGERIEFRKRDGRWFVHLSDRFVRPSISWNLAPKQLEQPMDVELFDESDRASDFQPESDSELQDQDAAVTKSISAQKTEAADKPSRSNRKSSSDKVTVVTADGSAPELRFSNRIQLEEPDTHGGVHAFAFAPDGKTLAGGTGVVVASSGNRKIVEGGGEVVLWNAGTGKLQKTLEHGDSVRWLAFSKDGRTLVSASRGDGTIKVWEMPTGQLRHTLKIGAEDRMTDLRWPQLALSADGSTLATVNAHAIPFGNGGTVTTGGELNVWDLESGKNRWSMENSKVHAAALSADGRSLIGALRKVVNLNKDEQGRTRFRTEHSLQSWNAETGEPEEPIDLGRTSTPEAVTLLDEEKTIALVKARGLSLHDRQSGDVQHTIEWHKDRSFGDAFISRDGKTVSRAKPGWMELIDVATGRSKGLLTTEFPHHMWNVTFSPDLMRAACKVDHQPVILDLNHAELAPTQGIELVRKFEPRHKSDVRGVALSDDGTRAVSVGGTDHTLRVWDVPTGKQLRVIDGHEKAVWCVDISPDGSWAVSTDSAGGNVIIWDLKTGEELRRLEPHGKPLQSASISPDGALVASGGVDRVVRISDAKTGRLIHRIETDSPCLDIAFLPDSSRVLLATFRSVTLWDVRSGKLVRALREPFDEPADSVAISADAHLAAAGGTNGTIQVWQIPSGKVVGRWKGHRAYVHSLAFLPNGRFLLSGGDDGTLCVWEAGEGRLVERMTADDHGTSFIALAPDGQHVLSGGGAWRDLSGQHKKDAEFPLYLWRLPERMSSAGDASTGREMVKPSGVEAPASSDAPPTVSVGQKGNDTEGEGQTVEAGCAKCMFNMKGVETCELAVMIDSKAYLVTGEYVDPTECGLCQETKKVQVVGRLLQYPKGLTIDGQWGEFVAESIQLQE